MEKDKMAVHFIAIGGSLMHSLAIALKKKGYQVTGSDDEIYEPSKANLSNNGILPEAGWDPSKITEDLEAVILGMHARSDNPELLRAREMGITIYSAPEFIYKQSKNKQRFVIAGSHGKSTITSIVIHVLKYYNRKFDYAVGAHLPGFDNMVQLTDAPVIIIEGDEYPSSAIDNTPKILNYHHHVGLISGIAWDHINAFPTEEEYVKQFDIFADATPKGGTLIYCEEDDMADVIGSKNREDVHRLEYKTHAFEIANGKTYLLNEQKRIPVKVFGRHNMRNISGAMKVLQKIGITKEDFYLAIPGFKGTDMRLQLLTQNDTSAVFKDFAHAPSKVLAATIAVKEQYPDRDLIACLELHTFSSLNKDFLPTYKGGLRYASQGVVYYNPKTVEHKKLDPISEQEIKKAFGGHNLFVFTKMEEMRNWLIKNSWENKNLLLMSSGTFDNMDLGDLSRKITS